MTEEVAARGLRSLSTRAGESSADSATLSFLVTPNPHSATREGVGASTLRPRRSGLGRWEQTPLRRTTLCRVLPAAAQVVHLLLDVSIQLVNVDDLVAVEIGGTRKAVHNAAREEARLRLRAFDGHFLTGRGAHAHDTAVVACQLPYQIVRAERVAVLAGNRPGMTAVEHADQAA